MRWVVLGCLVACMLDVCVWVFAWICVGKKWVVVGVCVCVEECFGVGGCGASVPVTRCILDPGRRRLETCSGLRFWDGGNEVYRSGE